MKQLLVGLMAAAAVTAACSNNDTISTPVVASVTMVPALDTVLGADSMLVIPTGQLAAVLKDANGNVLSVIQTGQTVDWTSSAPSVARVGQNGIVRGLTLGSATITAAIEGKSNSAVITVDSLVTVASVSVSPSPDSVRVDNTVSLKAWPIDAAGDTLTAAFTIWTSSDTALAQVSNANSTGVAPGNTAQVKGRAAGTVTITAKIAGVSGTGSMKVKP
jgi:uncharacterized protein YjdB